MKILILLFYCFSSMTITSAQQISYQIIDLKSKLPIAYANVGVVGKNIGTVSDTLGHFKLSLNDILDTDILRVSMIAYKTRNFNVGVLRKSKTIKFIPLEEQVVQLKEVVISNEKHETIQLGLKRKYCYPIPLYKKVSAKVAFPQKNGSHEIGTRFTNSKTIYLDSIQLNLAECNLDTIEIRLNIYSIKNEIIKNILTQPIYISLTKEEALSFPIIDITEHNIEFESDFLITIENHTQMPDGALYLLANFKRKGEMYPTYYKKNSHSHWRKLETEKYKTIGISILAFGH